jgi:DNA-binding transcriptional MerR regulator
VAAQLGVTVATVNRWANAGTLPVAFQAHGIRGARYFHPDTVARMRTDAA